MLTNGRLHPTDGTPNYNVTHAFSDLLGVAVAGQLPSNVVYGSGASPFLGKWTAGQTQSSSIFQDDGTALKGTTDNIQDLGTTALRFRDVNVGRYGLFGVNGAVQSFMIRPDNSDVTTPHIRPDSSGNVNLNPGPSANLLLAVTRGNLVVTGRTLYPNSHNAFDVGFSTTQAFRNGFFAGQVKARTKNVIVVENLDETQTSATIPNADTDLKTYVLPANSYTHVIVEAEGYVAFTTLSTNQDVNLKIKDGSTQVGQTMKIDAALSATSKIPFSIKTSFVDTIGATLHITHGAAAADANTTTFLNSLRVYGES